jgi:hypothetical protein
MRYMAATLALAFAAAPVVAQDHAVPRGGGSSGGGSSSSGGGHTSSGSSSSSSGGSSSSSSGSSGSSYSGSGRSSHSSSSGSAERRHPRAGTGTGDRYYYGGGGYYSGYYPWYPWYYPASYAYGPYWGSYYYGYWPYGAYYSGGYAQSYRSPSDESGAFRVLVDPEDAKVYVDGYYAGKVDDFDGFSQRLNIGRGTHEILLKRDGYKSQRYRVYAVPGETVKIEHDMSKGQGEEPLLDLTGGRADEREGPETRGPIREDRGDEEVGEDVPPQKHSSHDDAGLEVGHGSGRLEMRVWPADASVYIDGEFRGTGRQVRSLEMGAGPHRVEIVRPGFPTYQREVEIRSGRTESLQVTLEQP